MDDKDTGQVISAVDCYFMCQVKIKPSHLTQYSSMLMVLPVSQSSLAAVACNSCQHDAYNKVKEEMITPLVFYRMDQCSRHVSLTHPTCTCKSRYVTLVKHMADLGEMSSYWTAVCGSL